MASQVYPLQLAAVVARGGHDDAALRTTRQGSRFGWTSQLLTRSVTAGIEGDLLDHLCAAYHIGSLRPFEHAQMSITKEVVRRTEDFRASATINFTHAETERDPQRNHLDEDSQNQQWLAELPKKSALFRSRQTLSGQWHRSPEPFCTLAAPSAVEVKSN